MSLIIERILCGIVQRFISLIFTIKVDCKGKVFMFHQVTNNVMDWKDSEYCITSDAFTDFLEEVMKKYRIGHAEDLIENITMQEQYAFITFDDAYACVYNEAVPLLLEKNIPFTVFMTTDFIGKEGYMTREMIEILSRNTLCTIGAHGVSHKMFRKMPVDEAVSEIRNSKAVLSSITGKCINLFAFPYGSVLACSMRDVRLLQREGYKMGFSTIMAPLNSRSTKNKYFIPRYNINQKNYIQRVK